MKYSLHFKCRKSIVENGRFEQISFILGCQRAACNQQTMQISRLINRFDDCKKVCSPNMWVCWQHSCSNAVPIMIDNLLCTSPEMVTCRATEILKSKSVRSTDDVIDVIWTWVLTIPNSHENSSFSSKSVSEIDYFSDTVQPQPVVSKRSRDNPKLLA